MRRHELMILGRSHFALVLAAHVASSTDVHVLLAELGENVRLLEAACHDIAEPDVARQLRRHREDGAISIERVSDIGPVDAVWIARDADFADPARSMSQAVLDIEALNEIGLPGILLISTQLPIGSTRSFERLVRRDTAVAHVVENVRRGQSLRDLRSSTPLVIGSRAVGLTQRLRSLFGVALDWHVVVPEAAELFKHSTNALLATSITLVNELSVIGAAFDVNFRDIEPLLRADPRIGPLAYVRAGQTLGPGPLLRDVTYLTKVAATAAVNVQVPLIDSINPSNRLRAARLADRIRRLLASSGARPRVAIWGLGAKEGVSSASDSPLVPLLEVCQELEAIVRVHDPAFQGALPCWVGASSDPLSALQGADLLLVGQAGSYGELDRSSVEELLSGAMLYDPLNVLGWLVDVHRVDLA